MKLMVLDGNSIVNRAYYGIRPLTTRQGLYTNAIYGFVTTLQRLLDEEKPEALCVTFDRREPTFRRGVYTGSCDIPGVLSCVTLRAKFDGGTASALFVMDDSGFWAAAPLHSISVAPDRSCAVIRLWTEHTVTDGHVSGRWDADNFSYVAIGDRNAARALASMQ